MVTSCLLFRDVIQNKLINGFIIIIIKKTQETVLSTLSNKSICFKFEQERPPFTFSHV